MTLITNWVISLICVYSESVFQVRRHVCEPDFFGWCTEYSVLSIHFWVYELFAGLSISPGAKYITLV